MKQLNAHTDDPVSEVLARLRVHSTVYCLAELRSPWGFRVEGDATLQSSTFSWRATCGSRSMVATRCSCRPEIW
jgi:Cupin